MTAWRMRKYFNPRSHKGSDSVVRQIVNPIENFNPRSHKGSDIKDSESAGVA